MRLLVLTLIVATVSACAPGESVPDTSAPEAEIIAERVAGLDTDADEYGPVLTADGTTVFYAQRVDRNGAEHIVQAERTESGWSQPEVLPFSGGTWDKEPFISPDGKTLYFASVRPDSAGGDDAAFDLWSVQRTEIGWGEPIRLSDAVNSDDYDNYPYRD